MSGGQVLAEFWRLTHKHISNLWQYSRCEKSGQMGSSKMCARGGLAPVVKPRRHTKVHEGLRDSVSLTRLLRIANDGYLNFWKMGNDEV